MQISYNNFILNEKLGINEDVIKISEIIFKNIRQGLTKIKLPENKLNIKEIIINYTDSISIMGHNISDSTENKIIININPYIKINLGMIYHEMNHILQFIKIGKNKSKEKLNPLMSMELTMFNNDFQIKILKDFINFIYYLQKDEIDSYIYNSYYEIKKFIKENNIDIKNINNIFPILIKNTLGYKILTALKLYNVDNLKQLDNDILIRFINTINKNKDLILKYKLENIENAIDIIKKGLLPQDYKILNIDDFLKKVKIKQKNSIKYFEKKLFKLNHLIKYENDPTI